MENSSSVSRMPFPDTRYSSGVGYIHLPSSKDISRENHIYDCLQNSCVTVYIEGEGQKHQVPISVNLLNDIVFPEKYGQHGSRVVWVNDPLIAQIYVVAVLATTPGYIRQEEHSFRFVRRFNSGFVELTGDANTNSINVSTYSPTATKINFSATDLEDSSEIVFRVTGKVSTISSQEITSKSNSRIKLTVEDKKEEKDKSFIDVQVNKIQSKTKQQAIDVLEDLFITVGSESKQTSIQMDEDSVILDTIEVEIKGSEKITLNSKKVIINEGSQAMVLGDKLKDLLDSFIDKVSDAVILTPTGPGSIDPSSKVQIKALKLKTKFLLSKVGFLD